MGSTMNRRRWRKNRDILLQTQDARRAALQLWRREPGSAESASVSGIANSFAAFLSTGRTPCSATSSDRPAGDQTLGDRDVRSGQMGTRRNLTVDLGLRWEFYKPLEGVEGTGTLSTTTRDQYAPSGRLRQHENAINVKNYYKNSPPHRVSWRLTSTPCPRGLRRHDSVSDNRFAFNTVKQNYAGSRLTASERGHDGADSRAFATAIEQRHPRCRARCSIRRSTWFRPICTRAHCIRGTCVPASAPLV